MFSTTDLNPLSKATSITQLFSVTGLDGSFAALLNLFHRKGCFRPSTKLSVFQCITTGNVGWGGLMTQEKGNIQGTFGLILGTGKGFQFFFCTLVLNKELLYVIYDNVVLSLLFVKI